MKLVRYTGPDRNSYDFFDHYYRIEFEFEIKETFDSHVCVRPLKRRYHTLITI